MTATFESATLSALWREAWRVHKARPAPWEPEEVEETEEEATPEVVYVPVPVEVPKFKNPIGFRP